MVKQWGEDGMTISQLLMKEFSVVSVPANQNALVSNKALNQEQITELHALANAYARKMLTKGDNEINKNIEVLETLVATLKEVAQGEPHDVKADEVINRRVILRQAQVVDKQVETVIRQIKLKGDN
jgi:SpoU rRNA methylase family enzyme